MILFSMDNYFNGYRYNCFDNKENYIHLEHFNGVLFLFPVEYYFLFRVFSGVILPNATYFMVDGCCTIR